MLTLDSCAYTSDSKLHQETPLAICWQTHRRFSTSATSQVTSGGPQDKANGRLAAVMTQKQTSRRTMPEAHLQSLGER